MQQRRFVRLTTRIGGAANGTDGYMRNSLRGLRYMRLLDAGPDMHLLPVYLYLFPTLPELKISSFYISFDSLPALLAPYSAWSISQTCGGPINHRGCLFLS